MDLAKSSQFKFIGSWKLASLSAKGQGGHTVHPLGPKAQGRLIYGADGRMMLQAINPDRPKLSSDDPLFAPEGDIRAAFTGCTAYYGTYTFNEADQTITHHIEGHSIPNWVDRDYIRRYEYDGKLLTLKGPIIISGMQGELDMAWERC